MIHDRDPLLTGGDRLLSVPEVADRLSVSQKTVRNWLSQKKLAYVKIGSLTKIRTSVVEALIEVGTVAAKQD